MTWTRFHDMHSGGGCKEEPYEVIYIEAPVDEARIIFYHKFNHNPARVTCTCCGEDYSVSEDRSLKQLTAFDRGCEYVYSDPDGIECGQSEAWQSGSGLKKGYKSGYVERESTRFQMFKYTTLAEYKKRPNVLFIHKKDIIPEEREGHVPTQGYVWIE